MKKDIIAIILAAGKGTRMKSKNSKLLQKIYGKEIITRAVENVKRSGIEEIVTVVGYMKEEVKKVLNSTVKYAYQEEMLGTGHAVMQAEKYLKGKKGKVLILNGDHPIIRPETLETLVDGSIKRQEYATVLSIIYNKPNMYGRIIRDESGNVEEIVEYKDATHEQLEISEVSTGMYCFDIEELLLALNELDNNNAQKEYYLPDIIKIMNIKGLKTGAVVVEDSAEMLGINDRMELSVLTKALQLRINTEHMLNGVTIEDINSTYIYDDVEIGIDTVVHPNTTIKSGTVIGENCEIGPNAYIREDCKLDDTVKIGSFSEIKNSKIGTGSKIPHLSYIGDTEIGENCNIGCGTITCNYDGFKKSKTIIGDNVFVGSNVNFIAPIKIGDNSFIAAGSTISKDVSSYDLAIERNEQRNIKDWNKK